MMYILYNVTPKQNQTMKYLAPSMKVEEAQAAQMLAESLIISDTTVDGSQALGKEDNSWNIWNEEE